MYYRPVFGKSCMRTWLEISNKKNCLFCNKQFTDNEIKEIKHIPLRERMVIISNKAMGIFGQTISSINHDYIILFLSGGLIGIAMATGFGISGATIASEAATGVGLSCATFASGAAAGAVGAAVRFHRTIGVAAGAAAGVGATGVVILTFESFLGAVTNSATPLGCAGAFACGTLGAIGAYDAYYQQERYPVVV